MNRCKNSIALMLLITIVVQGLMGSITLSQNDSSENTQKLFSDISNHWAKESINFLAEKDYVSGYVTDEGYIIKPESNITRAEYLTVLLKTKNLEVIEKNIKEFTDVKDNHWFKETVDKASSNGILEGYPDGSFRPDSPITRAEIAALLTKLNNWTSDKIDLTTDNFIDVEKNSWFYNSVMICRTKGIISGYPDKSFKSHNYASRGEAFALIANYIKSINSVELDMEKVPTPENTDELIRTLEPVSTPTSPPILKGGSSSRTTVEKDETSVLEIYVSNNNQVPLTGAKISAIPNDENLKGIVLESDENGYVEFDILAKKEYKIIIEKEEYKSVIKENIILDADDIVEKRIILHELINEIYVEHFSILANQEISNRIYAKVLINNDELIEKTESILSPIELLVLNNDGNWNSKGFLFDNGNLDKNGDEIKGDQIYTNIFEFNESEAQTLNLKVVASMKDGTKLSKEFSIFVLEPLPDEMFESVLDVNNYITEYSLEYFNSNEKATVESLIDELQNILTQDDRIKEVNNLNGTIEIVLSSGLRSFIQIVNDNNMETMPRGSSENFQGINEEEYHALDYDYLISKDILLWSPFDTKWGEAAETSYIEEIVKASPYKYNLDILRDENANIKSLKKIYEYGIIVFSTHGINGDWIVTGEKVESSEKYRNEQQRGEVSIYNRVNEEEGNIESYYMVNSKWFERNIQKSFPKSIIINNSCESTKTDLLWDVFKQKGAATYYGYSNQVTNEYVVMQSVDLLAEIILDKKSTLEAYNPSLDKYYNDGGMFLIKGQANLKLPTGLINGSFESDLAGWQKDGDGRSITQLGSIRPTEGNKMGIISTGMGYTLRQGIISQSIHIPETANSISFDWNFLSEEFLEYIGSKFDDPFVVSLTLETQDSEKIKVLDISVNKIAEMFNATKEDGGDLIPVSPEIAFDKGDVWMTGWQSIEFDIKDYRGQNVVLKFSVEDAVDTIYTTAVLIDNIKLDVEDIYDGTRIEVDSSKKKDKVF